MPRAEADLEQIGDFIAQDHALRAKSFIRELRARCTSLSAHPWQGRATPTVGAGVRVLIFRSYLIFYRVDNDVEIDRVIHGARDLDAALEEES